MTIREGEYNDKDLSLLHLLGGNDDLNDETPEALDIAQRIARQSERQWAERQERETAQRPADPPTRVRGQSCDYPKSAGSTVSP